MNKKTNYIIKYTFPSGETHTLIPQDQSPEIVLNMLVPFAQLHKQGVIANYEVEEISK